MISDPEDKMLDFIYDDLDLFVKLVEIGNITLAAQKLNLTRATLKQRVKQLEKCLGYELIYHGNRKFELTKNGRMIYAKFASSMHQLQESIQSIHSLDKGQKSFGIIRLALPGAFMHSILSLHLNSFLDKHPNVSLSISYRTLGRSDLINNQFDLAICNSLPELQSVKVRKLGDEYLKFYAHPRYIELYGTPKSIADLSKHKCIGYLYNKKPLNKLLATNLQTAKETPFILSAQLYFDSTQSMLQIASKGEFIVYLPRSLAHNLIKKGELVEILPQYSVFSYSRYLISHSGVRSKIEHELIDFIDEVYKNYENDKYR